MATGGGVVETVCGQEFFGVRMGDCELYFGQANSLALLDSN